MSKKKPTSIDIPALLERNRALYGNAVMTAPPEQVLPPSPLFPPPPGPTQVPSPTLDPAVLQQAIAAQLTPLQDQLAETQRTNQTLQDQLAQQAAERQAAIDTATAQARTDAEVAAAQRFAEMDTDQRIAELQRQQVEQSERFQQELNQRDEAFRRQQAINDRENQLRETTAYRDRRVAEEGALIHPALADLVTGYSVDEVEASIAAAKTKTDAIVATFSQSEQQQRQTARGVAPTGQPPASSFDNLNPDTQTVTAEDIANMSMAEYTQHRGALLAAAKTQVSTGAHYGR